MVAPHVGHTIVTRRRGRDPREIVEVKDGEYVVARGSRTDRISWNGLRDYVIFPPGVDARWVSRSYSMVDNYPLRKAFIDSGQSVVDVCWRLGLTEEREGRVQAQSARLRRALGIEYDYQSGYRTVRASTSIDRAKAICEAIGVDFDDLYPDISGPPPVKMCSCGEEMVSDAEMCGFCIEQLQMASA